jgi:hypothetical protein
MRAGDVKLTSFLYFPFLLYSILVNLILAFKPLPLGGGVWGEVKRAQMNLKSTIVEIHK